MAADSNRKPSIARSVLRRLVSARNAAAASAGSAEWYLGERRRRALERRETAQGWIVSRMKTRSSSSSSLATVASDGAGSVRDMSLRSVDWETSLAVERASEVMSCQGSPAGETDIFFTNDVAPGHP